MFELLEVPVYIKIFHGTFPWFFNPFRPDVRVIVLSVGITVLRCLGFVLKKFSILFTELELLLSAFPLLSQVIVLSPVAATFALSMESLIVRKWRKACLGHLFVKIGVRT